MNIKIFCEDNCKEKVCLKCSMFYNFKTKFKVYSLTQHKFVAKNKFYSTKPQILNLQNKY